MRQQGGRVSSPEVSAGLGFGNKGGLGALALLEEETLQQEEAECWSKLFSEPQTLMVEAEKQKSFFFFFAKTLCFASHCEGQTVP